MSSSEPRNPFYILLMVVSLLFVVTALAVAVVPVLEKKAVEMGQVPPPSPFRAALRSDGWRWLLWEVGAVAVLGLLSIVYDRLRRLQNDSDPGTILPNQGSSAPDPSPAEESLVPQDDPSHVHEDHSP